MVPYQTPEFYEDVHHYPMYKQDGVTPNTDKSFRSNVARRQFATPDTAKWVGQLYNATAVFPAPYLGFGEAFDKDENSVQQYHVTIRDTDFVAGEIAYYFTRLPKDYEPPPIPNDPGMWPWDLPDDEVMKRGKGEADKWVESSILYKEPK